MERFSRFQPGCAPGGHWVDVRAEPALAKSGCACLGAAGTFAGPASDIDGDLSGRIVGVALSALPSPRVFARTLVPCDPALCLHLLHSLLGSVAGTAVVLARARERSLDRRYERGDDRADTSGLRGVLFEIALRPAVPCRAVRRRRVGAGELDDVYSG